MNTFNIEFPSICMRALLDGYRFTKIRFSKDALSSWTSPTVPVFISFLFLSVRPSACLSVSVYQCVCTPVCVCVCVCVWLSVCLCVCLSVCLYACVYVFPSLTLSIPLCHVFCLFLSLAFSFAFLVRVEWNIRKGISLAIFTGQTVIILLPCHSWTTDSTLGTWHLWFILLCLYRYIKHLHLISFDLFR